MKPNIKSRTVFLGDNIDFLRGINSECVDLICTDPPFNKKKQFTAPLGSQAEGANFLDLFCKEDIKDEWVEEFRQENYELYSFLAGIRGLGNLYNYCYLVYMAVRLIECHRILKSTGSLYLHCDPTMSHYLKLLLDCIFDENQFRNEIVWHYKNASRGKKILAKSHDIIFWYSKNDSYTFRREDVLQEYESGMTAWRYKKQGKKPPAGKTPDDVLVIPNLNTMDNERTGWPTQKPLALYEWLITAGSNPGDLVLDPFCGCVTTCIAAERLGRDWIGIDAAKEAWNQIEHRLQKDVPPNLLRGEDTFSTTPPKRGKGETRPKKYVYVISNPAYKGMYKVGVAANAEARLSRYQTADPKRRYKLEYKLSTPEYKTLEPHIHRKFDGDHEWVPADLNEIIGAIKSYRPAQ